MSELTVGSDDVVKLIMQFCLENGLTGSLKELQKETSVSLNIVDNLDTFMSDILNGSWDKVLKEV